ncbi:MAG: HIT family protein [Sphingobium sp.]
MSLDGSYDAGNIFALIVQGKVPATRLYEDEHTLAFLDIMPQSRGHALVISKWSQARNILEIENEALDQVMTSVKKVTAAIRAALRPDGFQIIQFNGSDAGQTIFHLHVHIIPRWKGESISLSPHGRGGTADAAELEKIAEQIRAAI